MIWYLVFSRLLSAHAMKETSRAMYVRSSSYVEVPATRSNSYQAFAKKAAKLLKMEAKKGEELKLFKLNGAVIVDEKIDVGGGCPKVGQWEII